MEPLETLLCSGLTFLPKNFLAPEPSFVIFTEWLNLFLFTIHLLYFSLLFIPLTELPEYDSAVIAHNERDLIPGSNSEIFLQGLRDEDLSPVRDGRFEPELILSSHSVLLVNKYITSKNTCQEKNKKTFFFQLFFKADSWQRLPREVWMLLERFLLDITCLS